MKIIYQKPFEDFKVPNSDESETWDIFVSKTDCVFIFVRDMWFVLFDSNLEKSIASDLFDLINSNQGLYKEILDDFKLINFKRYREIENNIIFQAFKRNLEVIWNYYEQGTASTTN